MEPVLFYTVTSLHNLLLHQHGSKMAVRLAEDLEEKTPSFSHQHFRVLAVDVVQSQLGNRPLHHDDYDSDEWDFGSDGPRQGFRGREQRTAKRP